MSIARRVGQAVIVLWAAFSLAFLLLSALPGDAVQARYEGPALGLTPEQIAQMREVFGQDTPLWERYARSLGGFLTGDFGYSVSSGTAVSELLAQALPSTLRWRSRPLSWAWCWPPAWRCWRFLAPGPGCARSFGPRRRFWFPCPVSGWESC